MIPDVSTMYTRKQAAEFLGVSVPSLARWASLGNGPAYYKLGRHARYRRDDLNAFMASRRNGGAIPVVEAALIEA